MLAVLSLRQKNEIEIYAGLEAIPDVSSPRDEREDKGTSIFEQIKGVVMGCKKKGKRR
jgi:hypothetical protein